MLSIATRKFTRAWFSCIGTRDVSMTPGAFCGKRRESSQPTWIYTVYIKMLSARSIVITLLVTLVCVAALGQQTLKVSVDLVNVFMTVQDERGDFVTGLKREDFVVYDDGQPQEIAVFETESGVRSALAILVDTS